MEMAAMTLHDTPMEFLHWAAMCANGTAMAWQGHRLATSFTTPQGLQWHYHGAMGFHDTAMA